MSLAEYAALCAEYASDEIAQDATYGQVSAELAASIELMESVNPPLSRTGITSLSLTGRP